MERRQCRRDREKWGGLAVMPVVVGREARSSEGGDRDGDFWDRRRRRWVSVRPRKGGCGEAWAGGRTRFATWH
eukprot:1882009-Pleurochrysis_carterae.AAC.2